jgi:hypothetical protein
VRAPSREPRGFSLLLLLAGPCLIVALFLAASGADRGALSRGELLLLTASLLAGVAATAAAARTSPHDALMFLVVAGFVGALILGAVVLFGTRPHPVAAVAATGCAVAFAASTLRLFALRRARDPFPDLLAERFGEGAAVEMDDVQLVVEAPASPASADRPVELRIWLQNTRDEEREVQLHLDLADKSLLVATPRGSVTLRPLEAGVLAIPVSARPSTSGRTAANVWLTARGGGRRRRQRRATEVSGPTAPWMKALEVLAAAHNPLHLLTALRGERAYGVRLELTAIAARGEARGAPGEPRWTSTWRETAFARAARDAGLRA